MPGECSKTKHDKPFYDSSQSHQAQITENVVLPRIRTISMACTIASLGDSKATSMFPVTFTAHSWHMIPCLVIRQPQSVQ